MELVNFEFDSPGRMYLIYDRITEHVMFMHPILDVAVKINAVLRGRETTGICLLLDNNIPITSRNAWQYKITEYSEKNAAELGGNSKEQLKSRGEVLDIVPNNLPVGAMRHAYPVASKLEKSAAAKRPEYFPLYLAYTVECTWIATKGYVMRDYIELLEAYLQCKDIYFNRPDVMQFIEYDLQATTKALITKPVAGEIYQACMAAKSTEQLKTILLEIAQRTGSIQWEI